MTTIQSLLDDLESFKSPNVFNPWADSDVFDKTGFGPRARRERLRIHLDRPAKYLLIGEAPGYQGCHFSGIPFTSEALICNGVVPDVWLRMRFTSRPRPFAEPAATVVWGALQSIGIADQTVLWNAFAWHPHKPDVILSNRAPTRQELQAGSEILHRVVKMFDSAAVIAVGRVAEKTLHNLGVDFHAAVRHPSMGGATEFRRGMESLSINRETMK